MSLNRFAGEEEYCQAVLRARAMSGEEKILEGVRLFEIECEQMKTEIRKEHPELCEEMVQHELRTRLDLRREEEERGIYITVPLPESQRLALLDRYI